MAESGNYRQALGRKGEDLTCSYLENLGHMILERNWRSGHLEIDVISANADGIHFVEVKARRRNIQAPPQENVDYRKQKRLTAAALKYLNSAKGKPYGNVECSFDVMAVTFEGDQAHVEWIPNAYIPLYI